MSILCDKTKILCDMVTSEHETKLRNSKESTNETTITTTSHSPPAENELDNMAADLAKELVVVSPRPAATQQASGSVGGNCRGVTARGSRRKTTHTLESGSESYTSCDTVALEDFCSRPWVQESLNNPWHPNSVLSFFTGINCADPKSYKELIRRAKVSGAIYPLINNLGDKYCSLCQPFAPVIRAAGRKELVSSSSCDWASVDGIVAQIVLCSQLAKSCFRGSPEASAYNDISVSLSQELHQLAASLLKGNTVQTDYKRLRKSFASMSILAATFSSSGGGGGGSSAKRSGRGSAMSSSRKSTLDLSGTRTCESQRSNRSNASSKMTPPDNITISSSRVSSSGDHHSMTRSHSSGSISTVSVDEQLEELESIVEGGEDELF